MTVLSAQSIRSRIAKSYIDGYQKRFLLVIDPFHERTINNGMSFGLSACGYDIRIRERVTIKPGGFTLASTIEYFSIPIDLMAEIKDKSTWARRGIAVQNTIAEPGWHGFLTLEITNHSADTITIEAGSPIAQMVFHVLDYPTQEPYTGKYQSQPQGPVAAILE